MIKEIYVYRLIDTHGNQEITVLDEPSSDGCIGGYDIDGKYQQYDSYELYHAYDWAEEHGFKLNSAVMNIDIPDSIFSN